MKKYLSLVLLLGLLLGLCGCALQAPPRPAEEASVPAEESPTAETAASTAPVRGSGKTTLSASAGSAKETDWQRAYRALLEDPALLDRLIGAEGDYRKGYFGGWESPWERLPFTSYAAADLDGDRIPELLLYSEEMELLDLFTYKGKAVYLGYNDIMGFLPEQKAYLVRGHWHGAGGSYDNEYSVISLEENGRLLAYFDRLGDDEDATWTFLEGEESWYSGSEEEDRLRYEAMFEQYVPCCIPRVLIPFVPLEDRSGLENPCELSELPDWQGMQEARRECCRSFLLKRGWAAMGLNPGPGRPQAVLWDLDRDGSNELLVNSGLQQPTLVFGYDPLKDEMQFLGELGWELSICYFDSLVARDMESGEWQSYFFQKGKLTASDASAWVPEDFLSPPPWQDPGTLAASLAG